MENLNEINWNELKNALRYMSEQITERQGVDFFQRVYNFQEFYNLSKLNTTSTDEEKSKTPEDISWKRRNVLMKKGNLKEFDYDEIQNTIKEMRKNIENEIDDEIIRCNQDDVICIRNFEDVIRLLSIQYDSLLELKPEEQKATEDISWLKKQIKHTNNPMERKALEKRLNKAYKEIKKNGSKTCNS